MPTMMNEYVNVANAGQVVWFAFHGSSAWDRHLQTKVAREAKSRSILVRWLDGDGLTGPDNAAAKADSTGSPPALASNISIPISVLSIAIDRPDDIQRLTYIDRIKIHQPSALRLACVSSKDKSIHRMANEAGAQLVLTHWSQLQTVVPRVLHSAAVLPNPEACWLPLQDNWPCDW